MREMSFSVIGPEEAFGTGGEVVPRPPPTCWGWGFKVPGECEHDWSGARKNVGHCLNVRTCVKCGKEMVVDSSD